MFCDHCGRQIPDDSTFCPYCGKDLLIAHEPVQPSPIPGPQAPADTQGVAEPKKKPPVLWIGIAIVGIAIICLVFVGPMLLDNLAGQAIPGSIISENTRTTTTLTPRETTVPPRTTPRTTSTTASQTSSGYVTITSSLPPPPVAAFQGDPTNGNVPLQVQFTDRSTGQPTVWQWDFGDGGTSSEQNPVHIYAYPGTYTVTLKTINTGGSTSNRKLSYITAFPGQTVTVVPTATPQLISSFQYDSGSGPVPLTVQFRDTTQGGPITAYYWKFGDGATSVEKDPVHTYTVAGTYWPELTVTTVYGNAWSMSGPITVTSVPQTQTPPSIIPSPPLTSSISLPQAAFEYDTDLGPVPLTVTFTDQSTGSPTSWLWDFGDGGTSQVRNPRHTYNDVDSFYVTLTIQNTYGASMVTKGPIEVFYRF